MGTPTQAWCIIQIAQNCPATNLNRGRSRRIALAQGFVGQYSAWAEVQTGPFRPQEKFAFLDPKQVMRFREYWMPFARWAESRGQI